MDSTKPVISKKVALLGSHAVGKTSLISRFVTREFPTEYLTTIGLRVDQKMVELPECQVELIIWDIAGQDDPVRIPQYYLNGAHGYIFVVDLSRKSTWEPMAHQLDVLEAMMPKARSIIAGNKLDLVPDNQRGQLALPIAPDFLTSALTGEHVDDMFLHLAHMLIHHDPA
jgi:small GTP-binding protein